MSCPVCGEICRCAPEVVPSMEGPGSPSGHRVRKFVPDGEAEPDFFPSAKLIDPEAYDSSEQAFDVSLEEKPPAGPKFIVEEARQEEIEKIATLNQPGPVSEVDAVMAMEAPSLPEAPDPDAWRNEVTARLNRYRSRRRTPEPRYPSLQLKFESTGPDWRTPVEATPQPPVNLHSVAFQDSPPLAMAAAASAEAAVAPAAPIETPGKLIEFPRYNWTAPVRVDELAESIFDQPRILEVPEVEPPPPALGGILIGPMEKPEEEKRPGIEIPLQTPAMWRRVMAGVVDGIFVAAAVALFGYVFFRVTDTMLPWREAVLVGAAVGLFFWCSYQYLLMVYSGTTPGLAAVKLQTCHFDGVPAQRSMRRWRVLASLMSLASVGLGYFWCFLDEDQLCWHDRITRTYLAPR